MIRLVLFASIALAWGVGLTQQLGAAEEKPLDGALQNVVERVILFAPVAVGPLAEDYPEAGSDYATGMAERINVLVPGARAWASSTLPPSSDPLWGKGAVGAAAGAHLTILTTIDSVVVTESNSAVDKSDRVTAKVTLRALDAHAKEQWYKTVIATIKDENNPKSRHTGGSTGKAAWEGCKKGLLALKYWLGQSTDAQWDARVTNSDDPTPVAIELVTVAVESDPAGASIFVNNVFRGKTPQRVPLPQLQIDLRLHLDGYQAWQQSLIPSSDMHLKPALEKLGE